MNLKKNIYIYIHIHLIESLCCTLETLQINFTQKILLEKKFTFKKIRHTKVKEYIIFLHANISNKMLVLLHIHTT